MRICGLNRTTLLDYPAHVAATIFLGGCNFCCPFCQNGDLVLRPESQPMIAKEEVTDFLKKRKGILTGVCITGGEPTLEKGLEAFIAEIKEMDYLVKLDTNGYRPEIIKELLDKELLDYIAMDIKNSRERYCETAGLRQMDIGKIKETIDMVMGSGADYEFRTTLVKELHEKEDMIAIGKEIKGAKAYFLQGYRESGGVIAAGLHAYSKEEMEEMASLIRPFVPNVQLRGVE